MDAKLLLAHRLRIPIIALYPSDIERLDRKLEGLLY
jgi:hypothetical protein